MKRRVAQFASSQRGAVELLGGVEAPRATDDALDELARRRSPYLLVEPDAAQPYLDDDARALPAARSTAGDDLAVDDLDVYQLHVAEVLHVGLIDRALFGVQTELRAVAPADIRSGAVERFWWAVGAG